MRNILYSVVLLTAMSVPQADWRPLPSTQQGYELRYDPSTSRVEARINGEVRPMWDGVHRLENGQVLRIQNGIAVRDETIMKAEPRPRVMREQRAHHLLPRFQQRLVPLGHVLPGSRADEGVLNAASDPAVGMPAAGVLRIVGHGGPGDKLHGVPLPLGLLYTVDAAIGGKNEVEKCEQAFSRGDLRVGRSLFEAVNKLEIQVLTARQVSEHPFLAKLGPDVLSAEVERIRGQLHAERFRRRRLGSLLLDQAFLAGVGNYLRSEILFVARLHPGRRPGDCDDGELRRLAAAARSVSLQSYRHNGVTNDLKIARALRAEGQRRGQYRHWVFARGGQPCRICGTPVIEALAASRRIYHCPRCQPA